MAPALSTAAGPRRLDPDQEAKVQAETVKRYRTAGAPFASWLLEEDLVPCGEDEWDDLVVEFKREREPPLTRSQLEA